MAFPVVRVSTWAIGNYVLICLDAIHSLLENELPCDSSAGKIKIIPHVLLSSNENYLLYGNPPHTEFSVTDGDRLLSSGWIDELDSIRLDFSVLFYSRSVACCSHCGWTFISESHSALMRNSLRQLRAQIDICAAADFSSLDWILCSMSFSSCISNLTAASEKWFRPVVYFMQKLQLLFYSFHNVCSIRKISCILTFISSPQFIARNKWKNA